MNIPQDEEGYVTQGPLHLVPPLPPHWLGVDLIASSESTPTAHDVASAMNVDGAQHSRWKEQVAPREDEQMVTHQKQHRKTPSRLFSLA